MTDAFAIRHTPTMSRGHGMDDLLEQWRFDDDDWDDAEPDDDEPDDWLIAAWLLVTFAGLAAAVGVTVGLLIQGQS